MLIDTHCHIHERQFYDEKTAEEVLKRAQAGGVSKLLLIGTSESTSKEAIDFSAAHDDCYAVLGVHPHDAKSGIEAIADMLASNQKTVVGVGEIGLDYFYTHSPKETQIAALEQQLQWALDYKLPVSFHVREAFDDFWPILNNFPRIKGVLHSFTDNQTNLDKALSRGLYIGVNGISTFSKTNQDMWDSIPLEKMLLETDAPFLTPVPHRGKVNEPAFVRHVAEYHANRRGVELEHLARVTSANASKLFSL